MAKIYISSHHPDPANILATVLAQAGHTVSSTWHGETGPRPAADDAAAWGEKAKRNKAEIANSDVLVLIASPEHLSGEKRVSGGKFIEAGYAIGRCARVVTVGGVENGMLWDPHVEHAADADALVKLLAKW
jgi:hypothetical protein